MSWRLCLAIKGYTALIARDGPGDEQGAYIDLYDFDSMLLLRNHLSNRFQRQAQLCCYGQKFGRGRGLNGHQQTAAGLRVAQYQALRFIGLSREERDLARRDQPVESDRSP